MNELANCLAKEAVSKKLSTWFFHFLDGHIILILLIKIFFTMKKYRKKSIFLAMKVMRKPHIALVVHARSWTISKAACNMNWCWWTASSFCKMSALNLLKWDYQANTKQHLKHSRKIYRGTSNSQNFFGGNVENYNKVGTTLTKKKRKIKKKRKKKKEAIECFIRL